jgi:hypothetical protein
MSHIRAVALVVALTAGTLIQLSPPAAAASSTHAAFSIAATLISPEFGTCEP